MRRKGGEIMAYLNLKAEMAKKDISIERVSKLLGIHRNSVSNKINGVTSFTIEEAEKIHKEFFPEKKLCYLFKKSELLKQNKCS